MQCIIFIPLRVHLRLQTFLQTFSTDPDFLKPWPIGAAGIDPFHSYADMFNGEDVIPSNPEWVWARYSNDLTAHTQQSFPAHLSGFNHYCVTQKVIDAYRM